jgi:hypothetical protein
MDEVKLEFIDISLGEKTILLDILGYSVDEDGFIHYKDTDQMHICPYTHETVNIKNASILPGSTVIINTTDLAISEYFSEHIDELVI